MLQELYIKDFAIIQELRLEFAKGLNLITGETGAGKSIIIDALQLLLGGKGAQETIPEGAKESIIEGRFLIPSSFPLKEKYIDLNYLQDNDQEIVVRRIISVSGKNRSYLNGNMVNLATLSELSDSLLEIHGQNQQISLFKKSVQLSLLDAYAGLEETRESYEKIFNQWNGLSASLLELMEKEEEKKSKRSFIQFQVEELELANLDPQEEVHLILEKEILSKSEFLKTRSEEAYHILFGREENAVLNDLQTVCRSLAELSAIDPRAEAILQLVVSSEIQLKEGAALLRDYREKVESQPDNLERIEKRLFDLSQLKKKYSLSIPEMADHLSRMKKELEELNGLEFDIQALQAQLPGIDKKLEILGETLSVKRRKATEDLELTVVRELKGLKIDRPEFKVSFVPLSHKGQFGRQGKEGVSFLISMNPGFPPVEIEKAVSGGELSRLMLVLKTILSQSESVPVLVFDEIDTGVGGSVAEFIGKKLWKLSKNKQIFCITHLPQIASFGQSHFTVSKRVKNGKTDVMVKLLDSEERVHEIGRMLGGSNITPKTLKLAEELIANSPR
jgi:DNA repair protein RecN (Recombination protein N)